MPTRASALPALAAGVAIGGLYALSVWRRRARAGSSAAHQNASTSFSDTRDIPLAVDSGDYLVLDFEEIVSADSEPPPSGSRATGERELAAASSVPPAPALVLSITAEAPPLTLRSDVPPPFTRGR